MKKFMMILCSILATFLMSAPVFADPIVTVGQDGIVHDPKYGDNAEWNGNVELPYDTTTEKSTPAEDKNYYNGPTILLGKEITLNADSVVEGDVFIAAETVYINTTISGDVYIYANNIVIADDAVISGKLNYNENAELVVNANVDKQSYGDIFNIEITFADKVVSTLWNIAATIILAVILILIVPRFFENLNKKTAKYDVKKACLDLLTGLAILVATPVAIALLLLTIVGAPISLVLLLVYILTILIATPVAGYYIGKIICKRVGTKKEMIGAVALGVAAIKILSLIPYIGGFVDFAAMVLGIGLIIRMMRNR